MIKALIESPFAAPANSPDPRAAVAQNEEYLTAALRESCARGEAPFASHRFYTSFLNDNDPAQRAHGIEAGLLWGKAAEKTIVYFDRGISNGMRAGIGRAKKEKRPIEYRRLGKKEPFTEAEAEAFVKTL